MEAEVEVPPISRALNNLNILEKLSRKLKLNWLYRHLLPVRLQVPTTETPGRKRL